MLFSKSLHARLNVYEVVFEQVELDYEVVVDEPDDEGFGEVGGQHYQDWEDEVMSLQYSYQNPFLQKKAH